MRFASPLDLTFKSHLHQVYYNKDAAEEQGIRVMLDKFEKFNNSGPFSLPAWYYVIDYSSSRYLLMSDGIRQACNYDPREVMDSGLEFLFHVYQPDDFKVYNEKIFPLNAGFLKEQPRAEQDDYLFSYCFRVKSKSGKYVSLFQRGSYITSQETGLPLYSLGMITDITLIKRDRLMFHQVEKLNWEDDHYTTSTVMNNYFYPYPDDAILSRRELEVLKWMADGLSSKQVAAKLYLSENTIVVHRKNMLRKTNTKNVAELVAFAIRNGLL
jgi:DNA-binding CsgD family transcriptional regulator